jgi:uncharacterized phage protein (TIGR02220 family)
MARIRTIKPEFFSSEDIVALTPFARLLYVALWCEADREGRMTWKPGTFKLRYFPGDSINVSELADELLERGLIVLYGDGLAYIPTFLEHQHVNPREAASALPDPHASAPVDHASPRVSDTQVGREGKEGKGKEGVDMSGCAPDASPPVSKKPNGNPAFRQQARDILEFLNSKTGRNYQPVDANLDLILARLKEGVSEQDIRSVVAKKCREWKGDDTMDEFLRPKTLFSKMNFANYHGELIPEERLNAQ